MISTVLALVNPITTSDLGVSSPNLTAYRAGYIVAAALAFIAAFLARRVPDAERRRHDGTARQSPKGTRRRALKPFPATITVN